MSIRQLNYTKTPPDLVCFSLGIKLADTVAIVLRLFLRRRGRLLGRAGEWGALGLRTRSAESLGLLALLACRGPTHLEYRELGGEHCTVLPIGPGGIVLQSGPCKDTLTARRPSFGDPHVLGASEMSRILFYCFIKTFLFYLLTSELHVLVLLNK